MSRLLAKNVQLTKTLTLLQDRTVYVNYKLNSDFSSLVELIENLRSEEKRVAVAAMLNRLKAKREVTVCSMTLITESGKL